MLISRLTPLPIQSYLEVARASQMVIASTDFLLSQVIYQKYFIYLRKAPGAGGSGMVEGKGFGGVSGIMNAGWIEFINLGFYLYPQESWIPIWLQPGLEAWA